MTLYTQPTKNPTRKVAAGTLAAALVVVITFVLELFGVEISGALTAALTTIIGFGLAYFIKDDTQDPMRGYTTVESDQLNTGGSAPHNG